jgi:hypothetical protein
MVVQGRVADTSGDVEIQFSDIFNNYEWIYCLHFQSQNIQA